MATLHAPPYLPIEHQPTDATSLCLSLNDFLRSLHGIATKHGVAHAVHLHGSASTGTLAFVVLDQHHSVLVSDIDIVFATPVSYSDRRAFLDSAQTALFQALTDLHISPGARVTELDLPSLNQHAEESSGLLNSSQLRSVPLTQDFLHFTIADEQSSVKTTKNPLPQRDMTYALPYALLRFHDWANVSAIGYAAATYELAKGISRTLWGDEDTQLGHLRFYALKEIEQMVSNQLEFALYRCFNKNSAIHLREHARIMATMIGQGEYTEASTGPCNKSRLHGWHIIFREIIANWPTSILANRIRLCQQSATRGL